MKFNIITHITTACNYDCSYCDVVKDKKVLTQDRYDNLIYFFQKNFQYISRFKFFGGEPLLAKNQILSFLDTFPKNKNFEIVTNTTLLDETIGQKLKDQFCLIFFSIDSENEFDFNKNMKIIDQFSLENKLYFNVIIDPEKIDIAEQQFFKLYQLGMRGFNFLPVYFTKPWSDEQLKSLSIFMKKVLDLSLQDQEIRLYGFQENQGYDSSLINPSLFIDVDGKVYYSDFVSTFSGKKIKDHMYICELKSLDLKNIDPTVLSKQKESLVRYEKILSQSIEGQAQLHKLMDYFSSYLNKSK